MKNIFFGVWCIFVGGIFAGMNFWYLQKQYDHGYEVIWLAIVMLLLIAAKAVLVGLMFLFSYQPEQKNSARHIQGQDPTVEDRKDMSVP